jgi:predicted HTH transcriptional regulator
MVKPIISSLNLHYITIIFKNELKNLNLQFKAISALLNTDGETLFIDIDNDGKSLGIEKGSISFQKKNSDGFILTMTNVINVSLGKNVIILSPSQ